MATHYLGTYFDRNLLMFTISLSVGPLQAFPTKSNSWVGSWLYQQTLDEAGKACQGQTL
jgi:hypothetical protein